jgi:hypothetical protein
MLGNIPIEATVSRREILTMLIWGKPAAGKTVLASTAPGKKLWLQFDSAGTASLERSDDILVADFSGYKTAQLENFKQSGIIERDLIKAIGDASIDTVVVDSLTAFGQMALSYAVVSGKANKGAFRATIENPGMTGYGVRTSMMLDFSQMVLRVCMDLKRHCIIITHEQEKSDDEGRLSEITLSLSGQTASVLPARISEVWHMEDTGKERLLYVRNHGMKRPMRTRMFQPDKDTTRFTWGYNQSSREGEGIAHWYTRWQANGFAKIAVPGK